MSDADQALQTEFLIQHSIDQPNVHGVPVTIYAIDSNEQVIPVGQAVSDGLSGTFKIIWTPPAIGTYMIVANFTGTQSYGPSYASTAIGVVAAASSPVVNPTTSPSPSASPSAGQSPTANPTAAASESPAASPTTATSPSSTPMSEIYIVAAAVIVIAIIAVTAVILRRRK